MSLSWVLAQRGVTSVLVGASSVAQLEQSLKCLESPAIVPEELPFYPNKVF